MPGALDGLKAAMQSAIVGAPSVPSPARIRPVATPHGPMFDRALGELPERELRAALDARWGIKPADQMGGFLSSARGAGDGAPAAIANQLTPTRGVTMNADMLEKPYDEFARTVQHEAKHLAQPRMMGFWDAIQGRYYTNPAEVEAYNYEDALSNERMAARRRPHPKP